MQLQPSTANSEAATLLKNEQHEKKKAIPAHYVTVKHQFLKKVAVPVFYGHVQLQVCHLRS